MIIMAHGLMAMNSAERARFRITSAIGDFSAQDVAELLHHWRTPQRG
ncbi:hypothetical protein [Sphingomonas xinjiangensis]|uniref:Uncharacterized protein n=1 Tax=Sphingomonas xinjiangensis TaxID=643568 RepID=A0A840YQY5_9SPHN|nr:hypothetical protein [Sphingomonas xinjiangensis]MBB5711502.1 hypothetical protein [Sphingomonas xinjiangensis]